MADPCRGFVSSRRIASIDYKHPFVLSGSSDKHIRLLDISTLQGWSTNPAVTDKPAVAAGGLGRAASVVCEACGSSASAGEPAQPPRRRAHEDLVRSVALNSDLVVSGSYDFTVKVCQRTPSLPSQYVAERWVAHRFGIGRQARLSPTLREDIRAASSA